MLYWEARKAQRFAEQAGFPVVVGPHPAFRLFSMELATELRNAITHVLARIETSAVAASVEMSEENL